MKPKTFCALYYGFAQQTQEKTGISAVFILAQAALESGWGDKAPGHMFFGVKDTDGRNGNEQLLVTTEYSRRQDLKFPEILSVEPVIRNGVKWFKYRVRDYFRKYDTPEQCFTDHTRFFLVNPRYSKAMEVRQDPEAFARAVAAAGYATAPDYAETLVKMIRIIRESLPAK